MRQPHPLYLNRSHAGKVLAEMIVDKDITPQIILALPRGGVPVAKEIATRLKCPFDVLIVRKIGAPFNPEYGIGAISEDNKPLFNNEELRQNDPFFDSDVSQIIAEEQIELKRRITLYRGNRKLPDVKGKTIILVDDGLATGVTAAAAGRFLKYLGAEKVILAVPVGPKVLSPLLKENVDEIICPHPLSDLRAIGLWYHEFHQVSDNEVISILQAYHTDSVKEKLISPGELL